MARPRQISVSKKLLLAIVPLLLMVLVLEVFGAVMTPAKTSTTTFADLFFVHDRDLVKRLRPGVQADFRTIRADLEAAISTNSSGFRGAEFTAKDADAFRVLVLGDSVTFGLGVGDAETYPEQLAALLRERAGGRSVQVRNLGVPGYSTFQGRVMFERYVVNGDFAPHLVVFGFGFNDGYLYPQTDDVTAAAERWARETVLGSSLSWLQVNSHFVAWLKPSGELTPKTCRVPIDAVRQNIEAVLASVPDDVSLLLVDSCLPHTYLREDMRELAASAQRPFLSFREAFVAAKGQAKEGVWTKGGRLRLVVNSHGVSIPTPEDGRPKFYAFVMDSGARRPNGRRVLCNDEGRDGDETAGDGYWTCRIEVAAGQRPEVGVLVPGLVDMFPAMASDPLLLNGVHLLAPGPGDGADAALTVRVDAPNLCPWPELVLLPDPIHASKAGCAVMARAVADRICAAKVWQKFVR